ncbi:MAG: hypothetical protein WCQ80_04485 [Bacilli bacterium]
MKQEVTFWGKFWHLIGLIFSKIGIFISAIKFMFVIPLVGIASSVFTFVILLISKTVLMLLLPAWLQIGLIESLISTVIFIVIMVVLYRDNVDHKRGFDPRRGLNEILGSAIIWAIPMYFIGVFLSDWISSYLATMTFSDLMIEPQESFFTLLSLVIYSPHMWLSTLTGDFKFTMMAALALNMIIFALFCRRDIVDSYQIQ